MGVRETLSKSKPLGIGLACLMILGGVVGIYVQAGGGSPTGTGSIFVTVDDGKTFVPGSDKDLTKVGAQAVRAHVFTCGGKQVVGYMTRYTADAAKLIQESRDAGSGNISPEAARKMSQIPMTGMELKKPGQAKWVPQADAQQMARIRPFVCPDGTRPPEVLPQ